MSKREEDRARFIARMVKEAPATFTAEQVSHSALLLMRHGVTYCRIQEAWCNEEMNERRTKAMEAKEARLENRIKAICATYGFAPVFQGDPRGCTVLVSVPSGYTNDWGRDGICVPGS